MTNRRQFIDRVFVRRHGPGAIGVRAGRRRSIQLVEHSDPLIEDLVAGNRILAMEGVLDAMGHISVRSTARPDRFLLARSMAPELVTAADILEYDLDGNAIDARDRTSYLERFIHSEIYSSRPDVRAVVHCHTASLIPFAASDVPLRAMYHMAAFVAEGVPVFDIRKAAGVTDLLVQGCRARQSTGARASVRSPPP